MNRSVHALRIALVVVNPATLRQGCAPSYSFGTRGGTIGCREADWRLSDSRGRVQPLHCEIVLDEGRFCVVDRSGHTRLNGCDAALGVWVCARLAEGDILHIGPYRVSVHLHSQQHELPDPSRHLIQYDLGELLNLQGERFDLFEPGPELPEPDNAATTQQALLDGWLQDGDAHSDDLDPMLALDADRVTEEAQQYSLIDDTHYGLTPPSTQSDLAATRFEAVSNQRVVSAEDTAGAQVLKNPRPVSAQEPASLLDIVLRPSEPDETPLATSHQPRQTKGMKGS